MRRKIAAVVVSSAAMVVPLSTPAFAAVSAGSPAPTSSAAPESAQAAAAGLFGDVKNRSSFAMRIAKWDDGSSRCLIWNKDGGTRASSTTGNCTTRSLATGSDDPASWDTDLFTFPNNSYTVSIDGVDTGRHAAGTYTRIHDNQVATCYTDQDGSYCLVVT